MSRTHVYTIHRETSLEAWLVLRFAAPSGRRCLCWAVDLRSKALSIECADTKNAARNMHTCANAEVASPDLVITALVGLLGSSLCSIPAALQIAQPCCALPPRRSCRS